VGCIWSTGVVGHDSNSSYRMVLKKYRNLYNIMYENHPQHP
jgi:hypothetical protein